MMDIKEVLLLWFTNFLVKILKVVVLIMKLNKVNNWLKNYTNQIQERSRKERFSSSFQDNIWGADLADIK